MTKRKAISVQLYEAGVEITTSDSEGPFRDWGNLQSIEIQGEELEKLAKIFGIPYGDYTQEATDRKTGKPKFYVHSLDGMDFNFHFVLKRPSLSPKEIYVEVLSPNMLELQLEYQTADTSWVEHLTYCGNFLVGWDND